MLWIIDGAVMYHEEGLKPPKCVQKATDAYLEDENVMKHWIKECCKTGTDYWDSPTDLFESWSDYAKKCGISAGTTNTFKPKMEAMGYPQKRTTGGKRRYVGIEIKKPNMLKFQSKK